MYISTAQTSGQLDGIQYLMLKLVSVAYFHFQDGLTSDLCGRKLHLLLFDVDGSLGEGVRVCSDGVRVCSVGDGGGGVGGRVVCKTNMCDRNLCGVLREVGFWLSR